MNEPRVYTGELRKTRVVCISDTHNQTPKLPQGDILIHAGDLTNQGSYSELKKTVEWLEKADFAAKIVIAGNHDLTLDTTFFEEHGQSWKWPKPQDPQKCQKLFENSPSIIYLEHEAATVYLESPDGPHTCFRVFGSPYSPKSDANWAFQYSSDEASKIWDAIPSDTDIVVTHTPPKGHCDFATKDDRSGCAVLLEALHRIRPMLSVFGHIHEARGAEIVQWNDANTPENSSLVRSSEVWKDPGLGNRKISLVNVSAKGGRCLNNSSGAGAGTRCKDGFSLASDALNFKDGGAVQLQRADEATEVLQRGSTSRLRGVADASEAEGMAVLSAPSPPQRPGSNSESDIGLMSASAAVPEAKTPAKRGNARRESVMTNAAVSGPRIHGRSTASNKPIVVDIDLPVWRRSIN